MHMPRRFVAECFVYNLRCLFGGSALFVPLIKAGLILQIAGFIFVLQTFARQDKGEYPTFTQLRL